MIRQLPTDVRSHLRSGVAITSVTQCVEEMLLNSLDAGATCVAVRVDLDCFKIQVVDNGSGIAVEELKLLGDRYATSKCHNVSDLDNLCYFGYRGEALASIRDSCSILEITSRTKQSSTTYCKIFQNGNAHKVTESSQPRPSIGTTVTVHDLFKKFPVRKKSTNENLELERIRQRVEGLALVKPGVSISLRNDATGVIVLQTHKCTSSLITFTHLFGSSRAKSLIEVKGSKSHFSVEGHIGREGHLKKDLQLVYINGRLVLKTKIHKLINQCLLKSTIFKRKYGQSGSTPEMMTRSLVTTSPTKNTDRYPVYILNVICPLTEYDVTFDPAKTLVEFKDWETLLQCTTDLINNFLRKENLIASPVIPSCEQDSAKVLSTDSSNFKKTQEKCAISPSDLRDTMFSKRAKRIAKQLKAADDFQTPKTVSLDTWKSDNGAKCLVSESDADCDLIDHETETDTTESYITDTTSLELSSADNVEAKGEFKETKDDDVKITERCNLQNTNISESKTLMNEMGDNKFQMCTKNEILSNPKLLNDADKSINEILGQPQKELVPKPQPKSSLSEYKKIIGKFETVKTNSVNIDESLKKMSQIISGSAVNSDKNSFSSLQRFRKRPGVTEHLKEIGKLRPSLGGQEINSSEDCTVNTSHGNTVRNRTQMHSFVQEYPKQVQNSGSDQPIDLLDKNDASEFCAPSLRLARKRPNIEIDFCKATTASKLSKLVKQKAATVTVDPEDNENIPVCNFMQHKAHDLDNDTNHESDPYVSVPLKFENHYNRFVNDIEGLAKDILGTDNYEELKDHDKNARNHEKHLKLSFEPCSVCSAVGRCENDISRICSSSNIDKNEMISDTLEVPSIKAKEHFQWNHLDIDEIQDIPYQETFTEENISGSQLFKNLPDIYNFSNENNEEILTAVPFDITVMSGNEQGETDRVVNEMETNENKQYEPMEYCTQGFSPVMAQSQSGLSDGMTEMALSQELKQDTDEHELNIFGNRTPTSEGFSPRLDHIYEEEPNFVLTEPDGLSPNVEMKENESFCNSEDIEVNKHEIRNNQLELNCLHEHTESVDDTQFSLDTVEPSQRNGPLQDVYQIHEDLNQNTKKKVCSILSSENCMTADIESPSITQLLKPETQASNQCESSNLENQTPTSRVTFSDIFTPTQTETESNESEEGSCSVDDQRILKKANIGYKLENISYSGCSSWSSCYTTDDDINVNKSNSECWSSFEVDVMEEKDPSNTCNKGKEFEESDINDDTLCDISSNVETGETGPVELNKVVVQESKTSVDVSTSVKYDTEVMSDVTKCSQAPAFEHADHMKYTINTENNIYSKKIQTSHTEETSKRDSKNEVKSNKEGMYSNHDNHWIQMTDPITGEKMFVHSRLGTTVPVSEWKGCSTSNTSEVSAQIKMSGASLKSTLVAGQQVLPEKYMTEFKTVPGSCRSRTRTNTSHCDTGASQVCSSTGAPTPGPSSAVHGLMTDHYNDDDTDIQVKWRGGHDCLKTQNTQTPDLQSVEDMFAAWDNPVFENMNTDVASAEASRLPSRSTIKAFKTVHTCTFTKDMLNTVKAIGQLDNKFIACLISTDKHIANGDADLLAVIDQHAAHERIRLEMLTEGAYVDNDVDGGRLCKFVVDPPRLLTLTEDEVRVMVAYTQEFSRIGIKFHKDAQSRDVVLIKSVPACLVVNDETRKKKETIYWNTVETLIKDHVVLLVATNGTTGRLPHTIHKILCSLACHGAIKFGDPLTLDECEALISDLSRCDLPFQCAHGRPAVMPVLQLHQLKTKLPQQKRTMPQLYKLTRALASENITE